MMSNLPNHSGLFKLFELYYLLLIKLCFASWSSAEYDHLHLLASSSSCKCSVCFHMQVPEKTHSDTGKAGSRGRTVASETGRAPHIVTPLLYEQMLTDSFVIHHAQSKYALCKFYSHTIAVAEVNGALEAFCTYQAKESHLQSYWQLCATACPQVLGKGWQDKAKLQMFIHAISCNSPNNRSNQQKSHHYHHRLCQSNTTQVQKCAHTPDYTHKLSTTNSI